MSESGAAAPTPAPQAVSAPARVIGTFFSPVSTFQSIAARPGFLLPLALWIAASLLVSAFILPRMDYEGMTRARLEKAGQSISEDRIQAQVAMQKRIAPKITIAIGALAPVIITLLVTLVFWASFKAFGWDFSFKQGIGVTSHAFLPGVLGALILIPVLSSKETIDPQNMSDLLRSNLGFLVERKASPALHSLLGSLDLFAIWTMVLLTIGYAAAARISRKAAGAIVVALWAVYILGKAGLAALFS
ncbi:MAG: YIP1 family protein [Acidobacteriota bacterium]|nr:YIP1 family protein [Acidobacteriota bacterium]